MKRIFLALLLLTLPMFVAFTWSYPGANGWTTGDAILPANMTEIGDAVTVLETTVADDADVLKPVDTTTAASPTHVIRNDWEMWFNIDGEASPVEGEGGHVGGANDVPILKTSAVGIQKLMVSLSETESWGEWWTLLLGGDGDGVGLGIETYCTGGAHAQGNEGCQGFRARVKDVWLTAFGTFAGAISSGAGTETVSITGGTITESESKMLGENKLIVFTASPVTVTIVDAPPGTINGGVLEDSGTAWSFDGMATGQGVFTLGAGQVTSSAVKANSWCIAPVDSNYTDINSQTSHLWLLIDQINAGTDTVRTRWENQGYNGRTPFPLLVGEGSSEAILAPCALLGPPTFSAGDFVTDSLTLVKGANFPAIASGAASAFEVAAYPGITETSFRALISNSLGYMYKPSGFKAVNQLDGSYNAGRFQHGAAFDVDVTGATSNLLDGTSHGWGAGLGCETPGECKVGVEYVYASDPTPLSVDQWLAQIDWATADWADDIDRIVIRAADDSTKNLTLDKTDGWGANGDPFARLIVTGTRALATSAIASGACSTTDASVSASGAVSTDRVLFSPNADPGLNAGLLTYSAWAGTNVISFRVCNPSAGSLTPGAVTMNWSVTR